MQNNNNNNESLKLLELTDDLKSLSDLELPEIINQRKRKVRRKTRSRTPTGRQQNKYNKSNEPSLPCYKNLGLWIAIFMTCGWLFILSYMTTVIHSENNRLKVEVQKSCNSGKRNVAGNGITSQDQLLSQSTDEQEDYIWPKLRSSSRCRTKRLSCLKTCGPLVLITCVFMSFGFMYWLFFDLRQQINEYRIRIEQVSASSQNVPDALQKWHETSKILEQNQTLLHTGMVEIRDKLKNISIELTQLREDVHKKAETSKDAELSSVQTSIAEFGAKIKDFNSNMEQFKIKFDQLKLNEKENAENITRLTTLFMTWLNNTNIRTNSEPNGMLLQSVKQLILEQIVNVRSNLSSVNYTLSERTKGIEEDLRNQTKFIDKFTEDFANLSSKVSSIDGDWTIHKQSLVLLEKKTKNYTSDLAIINNNTNVLNNLINSIQTECKNYHSQNENITKEIQTLKENLDSSKISIETSTQVTEKTSGKTSLNYSIVPSKNSSSNDSYSNHSNTTISKTVTNATI